MNQQNIQIIKQNLTVNPDDAGVRVDQFVAKKFPQYSRGTIQKWIASNGVLINSKTCKAKQKLKGFENITLNVSIEPAIEDMPQKMDLNIVFEDSEIIVINKPAGLLVHPGAGNPDNTLLNGLLAHNHTQSLLPRAGIVHRLDKMTSGLMVVAKTNAAYKSLVVQLKKHTVARDYYAIVKGYLTSKNIIDQPIGRHKTQRTKMAVVINGKRAVTHFDILENFKHYTAIRVSLETGRTHQIRVHMHYVNHQLLGDPVYGNHLRVEPDLEPGLKEIIREFPRQALHARCLAFIHPKSDKTINFKCKLPEDLTALIAELRDFDSINEGNNDSWDVYYPEV
ncbi:Ribosomal large subunit pseudouridine synthase D [hydrothermal vent metagenome]|uniref:Ribosomal large subunit pseudouridine synthase D n=1 Tax=hydrothermal vent metagenome TaxID=652676 RepID=A0A3B0V7H0_9ZZZZ